MPRGGARIGAGRPRGSKTLNSTVVHIDGHAINPSRDMPKKTPLAIMLEMANNEGLDENLRLRAAACAAPYVHARKQETGVGKKERDIETAREATVGKFQPTPPPGYLNSVN